MKLSAKVIEADMTIFDEVTIEDGARCIYTMRGYPQPWKDAVEWLALEPNSAPARNVVQCRKDARNALAAAEESLRTRGMWREGENVAWMAYDEHGIGYEQNEYGPVAIIQIKEPTTQNPEVK